VKTDEIKFPVSQNGIARLVSCRFATDGDVEAIREWPYARRPGASVQIQDAAEYAELATNKWDFYQRAGRTVKTVADVRAFIEADQTCEIILLLVAHAMWSEQSQIGFCMVRRTWANNLCVDFLALHPELLRREDTKIKGVGTGLMYTACALANAIVTAFVWGEATEASHGFYRHYFPKLEISDRFDINRERRSEFMKQREIEWRGLDLPISLNFATVAL
jgi:hypothetical protein